MKKGVDIFEFMVYTIIPASSEAQSKAEKAEANSYKGRRMRLTNWLGAERERNLKKVEKLLKKYLTNAKRCDIIDKLSTRQRAILEN